MNKLRSQFPILKTQLNGHDLIYLDSAATSQKPQEVIDAIIDFYANYNASSHSVHSLGGKVTEMVEETRQVVADFIGSGVDEVVFTSGATEGINLIANGFLEMSMKDENVDSSIKETPVSLETASPLCRGEATLGTSPSSHFVSRGNLGLTLSPSGTGSFATLKMTAFLIDKFKLTLDSEILICVDQHHSNILPWQRLAKLVGCKIVFFGILVSGRWDLQDFESKLNINTKVIAISNVSNVLGIIQNINELNLILENTYNSKKTPVGLSRQPLSDNTSQGDIAVPFPAKEQLSLRPIIVLDATQAVSHFNIDVKELDVDFMVFSGHKIYGPTGVGVLYGKSKLLEVLPNYKVGGDMVETVSLQENNYKESPFRFEAGTANFASIIGLKATLDWFIRSREEIFVVENQLLEYLVIKLSEVEGLKILGEFETEETPVSLETASPLCRGEATLGTSPSSHFVSRGNLGLTLSPSGIGSFASLKMTKGFRYNKKIPLVSFNITGVNSLDLALLLDQKGVCIRSGQHCAGILHEYLKIDSSCRISLACFNTKEEVDFAVVCINKAVEVLTK